MTKTVFITGSNRGIGLGLVHHYLATGSTVYAAARSPEACRDFWELERDYGTRFRPLSLDVTSEADARNAAASLASEPLDLLINNAGVLPKNRTFEELPFDDMRQAFEINVLGPMRVTQRLLANLQAAKRPVVATITSKMGSITDNTSGSYYAYRTSKTAVNMFIKSFALDHPKIATVLLHPGWVQTEMGGKGATVSVRESVAGLTKVIADLSPEGSGRFFDYKGQELPW